MSRAKKTARQQAEEATTRRRNSAAHRALRRRAAQGKGALALDPSAHDGVERTDAPVTSEQSTRPGSDGEVDTAGVAPVAPSAPSSSDADDEPAVDEAVVDE